MSPEKKTKNPILSLFRRKIEDKKEEEKYQKID
jgi:hypothetical protein